MDGIGFHVDGSTVYAAYEVDSGALGDVGDFVGVGGHACRDITQGEEKTSVGIAIPVLSLKSLNSPDRRYAECDGGFLPLSQVC